MRGFIISFSRVLLSIGLNKVSPITCSALNESVSKAQAQTSSIHYLYYIICIIDGWLLSSISPMDMDILLKTKYYGLLSLH